MPLLSILTATHAQPDSYLPETAASVAVQDLPAGWELEWIVQEDGASPAAGDLLAQMPHVRYEANHAQLGPAVTRNLALARARGSLVQLLDHDDLLLPGALATLIPLFLEHPIHWAVGQADDLLPDGTRRSYRSALPYGAIAPGLVNQWATAHEANWPIHCAGLMLRTTTLRALGGWIAAPSDDDIVMFAAVSQITTGYNEPTLTWLYRQHANQIHRSSTWQARSAHGRRIALQRATAAEAAQLNLPAPPLDDPDSDVHVGPPAKEARSAALLAGRSE